MFVTQKFRVSAVTATTATLVPVVGTTSKPALADEMSQIVVTFGVARDARFFVQTDDLIVVSLEKQQ